jgi:hypothetical protein
MASRVLFVQLKTGFDTDKGPAWISIVRFNRTWKTAQWHGRTLHRARGLFDANFYDVESDEEYWISGPHRDRRDVRYSAVIPTVDEVCVDRPRGIDVARSLRHRTRGLRGPSRP